MSSSLRPLARTGGFSLVELLVSIGVIGTISGAAILVMPRMVDDVRSNGVATQAMGAFRIARELAVTERRTHEVRFVPPNRIQIVRLEVPGPGETVVRTIALEGHQQFHRFAGMPDTPDAFGYGGALAFGPSPNRAFTTEGTFVDGAGDVLNGTLFLGEPGDQHSARAVTIFGPTGLLRVWRWNGRQWIE